MVSREDERRHPFRVFGLGTAVGAGRLYEPPQRLADPCRNAKRYRRQADPAEKIGKVRVILKVEAAGKVVENDGGGTPKTGKEEIGV